MSRGYLTSGVAPIDLAFRSTEDDFEVEEVPLYPPCGAGDHLYIRIEKRGISTTEALRGIARRLGRRPSDLGVAGLKDARAVARQTISIEHLEDPLRPLVDDPPRVRAIAFERHRNKLRLGHLKGNRFRVRLRPLPGAAPGAGGDDEEARARAVLDRLGRDGVPNFFGPQRFGGPGGRTHLLGRALLRGDRALFLALLLGRPGRPEAPAPAGAGGEPPGRAAEARALYERGDLAGALAALPAAFSAERRALGVLIAGGSAERAIAAIAKEERRLYVSAAQSAVFNALCEDRLARGALGRLERGDVAFIHRNGACFGVEEPEREQGRADRFEVSPTGPLFGTRLLEAGGAVSEREAAALAAFGLERTHFEGPLALSPRGARRPYRVPLAEVALAREADGSLRLGFFLPAGSYATAVLAEILKREVA